MATNCENLSPDTVNAIVKQLRELQSHPAEGINVVMNEENVADVHAEVDGPGTVDYVVIFPFPPKFLRRFALHR
jgi:hypothetical protein